jgi:hypothetical protein
MAFTRTGTGELTAVEQLCSSIRRDSSVVIVDRLIAQRFTQAIRGMCGIPAARMVGQQPGAVATAISAITAAGRHPVLVGSSPGQLTPFGGSPVKVVDLHTTSDPRQLTSPPTAPTGVHIVIWMTVPQAGAVGA